MKNTLQILDVVKAWAADRRDMGVEDETVSETTPRFWAL